MHRAADHLHRQLLRLLQHASLWRHHEADLRVAEREVLPRHLHELLARPPVLLQVEAVAAAVDTRPEERHGVPAEVDMEETIAPQERRILVNKANASAL